MIEGAVRSEPRLGAQVIGRTPLLYAHGPNPSLDRPAHVRAGSAVARLPGRRLAIVQDDASFIAIVDIPRRRGSPTTTRDEPRAEVRDIPLPSRDGVRQFDEGRGNKHLKLDLEACVVVDNGALLLAFGSGSTSARERVVLVETPDTPSARVTVVEAHALYASLRSERAFSGSELNIEGVATSGSDMVFFQRGNGASSAASAAVDATARMELRSLVGYLGALARGDVTTCPPLHDITTWELGSCDGTRLTFTDGVAWSDAPRPWLAFLACAEASPDATRDGPVKGVAIGRLDDRAGIAEIAFVLDERGEVLLDKAEGLAFDSEDASRAWVVVDKDDPTAASELLELRLGDAWRA